jgi:hypothetical protein
LRMKFHEVISPPRLHNTLASIASSLNGPARHQYQVSLSRHSSAFMFPSWTGLDLQNTAASIRKR